METVRNSEGENGVFRKLCSLLRRSWGHLHRSKRSMQHWKREGPTEPLLHCLKYPFLATIFPRVYKKMGNLGTDCMPVHNIKVQLPLNNQEGASVQEVFWGHSAWQKGLVPKLPNHETFLMSRYLYACPRDWGESLIGTVMMKVSPEEILPGEQQRKWYTEVMEERGHKTQLSPKQQRGVTREGRWAPTHLCSHCSWLLERLLWKPGSL